MDTIIDCLDNGFKTMELLTGGGGRKRRKTKRGQEEEVRVVELKGKRKLYRVIGPKYSYNYISTKMDAEMARTNLAEYGYKGVRKAPDGSKFSEMPWESFVVVYGKILRNGYHATIKQAARAHDEAMLSLKGLKAENSLNFDDSHTCSTEGEKLLKLVHLGNPYWIYKGGRWRAQGKLKRESFEANLMDKAIERSKKPSSEGQDSDTETEDSLSLNSNQTDPGLFHTYPQAAESAKDANRSLQSLNEILLKELAIAKYLQGRWNEAGCAILQYLKLMSIRRESDTRGINRIEPWKWRLVYWIGGSALYRGKGPAVTLRFMRSLLAFLEYYREHYDEDTSRKGSTNLLEKFKRQEHPEISVLRVQVLLTIAELLKNMDQIAEAVQLLQKSVRQRRYAKSFAVHILLSDFLLKSTSTEGKSGVSKQCTAVLESIDHVKLALHCKPVNTYLVLKLCELYTKFKENLNLQNRTSQELSVSQQSDSEDTDLEAYVSLKNLRGSTPNDENDYAAFVEKLCDSHPTDSYCWKAKTIIAQMNGRSLSSLVYDIREWHRNDPLSIQALKLLVNSCYENEEHNRDSASFESDEFMIEKRQNLEVLYEALVDTVEHFPYNICPPWSDLLDPRIQVAKISKDVVYVWSIMGEIFLVFSYVMIEYIQAKVMLVNLPETTRNLIGNPKTMQLWKRRFFDVDTESLKDCKAPTIDKSELIKAQLKVACKIYGSTNDLGAIEALLIS